MGEIKREDVPQNLYEAAELNGNGDKRKEISIYTEWAKNRLEREYGVKDLSAVEGVHLRNSVEEVLPEVKRDRELLKDKKMWVGGVFEVEEEAAARWLLRTCGINVKDIPKVLIVEDKTTGEKHQYEMTMEELGEQKNKELSKDGHEVEAYYEIPEDFKEHIRRIREKANHDV